MPSTTLLPHSTGDVLVKPHTWLGATLPSNATTTLSWGRDNSVYTTNDRGWRVATADQPSHKVDIAIAGCSWAFGYGVDYGKSFPALVGQKLNRSIANLGVNSYSLLQIMRRLRLELSVAHPDLIVLVFASWQTARCFKSNAYDGMLHRPIYRTTFNDGTLVVREPSTPPEWIIKKYTQILRRIRDGQSSPLRHLLAYTLRALCQFYLGLPQRAFRKIARLQADRAIDVLNQSEHAKARKQILSETVEELKQACAQYSCRALIWHIYEYPAKEREEEWYWAKQDGAVLETLCGGPENNQPVRYVSWTAMEQLLKVKGAGQDIHTNTHNHPNSKGHSLIAKALFTAVSERLILDETI